MSGLVLGIGMLVDNCNVEETCQENLEYKAAKRRSTPGSVAFVPSVAGLIIAGEVIKDLAGIKKK